MRWPFMVSDGASVNFLQIALQSSYVSVMVLPPFNLIV